MCAQLIEQNNIFLGDKAQVIEKPRDYPVIGRGTGDISEENANPSVRLHKLPKGGTSFRGVERCVNSRTLIVNSFALGGCDDCGPVFGTLNSQVTFAICELNLHPREVCRSNLGGPR